MNLQLWKSELKDKGKLLGMLKMLWMYSYNISFEKIISLHVFDY